MTRRYYLLALVAVGTLLAAMPSTATQQVTLTGEIIDSACYIKMGAKGAGHRECAQTCADAGIPLALLEQGTENVVWLAAKEDMTGANGSLRAHASHTVRITGEYAERGGARILVIDTLEMVSR